MSSPRSRPGSKPGKQRYALRRLGALVIVVVVGWSMVKVASGMLGGDDSVAGADGPAASDATANPATDAAGDADPDGLTGGTLESGTAAVSTGTDTGPAATDAVTETTGPATAENPAKVLIVGDSDAGTFGPYLEKLLDGTNIVDTTLDYKTSSGLARPDFYDWPAELAKMLPEVDPDIVVATFGGNDAQGLSTADGTFIISPPSESNEAEWTKEYERRVGDAMDLMTADGRTLIWVGIPNDDNPEVTARMAIQDKAAKAAAAARPDVVFIDTWKRFSGRDGNWAEFVIDPRDGQGKDVRRGDGFHLNTNGAEILALDVAQAVRDTLRAQGADI